MLLDLQDGIIYGPVNSRRLGRSLGINILPAGKKVCPFDCVYCQYGWTQEHLLRAKPNPGLPSILDVREAVEKALLTLEKPPAYITFSGNGEPTLHPDFPRIAEEVTALRNTLAPRAKTAILSNSALASSESVRDALTRLDVRIMKLDCGTPEMFKRYNRPCPGVRLDDITLGLSRMPDAYIQTLFSTGQSGNLNPQNVSAWIDRLKNIRPLSVQLYTLDRGFPAKNLKPADKEDLNRVKIKVEKAGIPADVF